MIKIVTLVILISVKKMANVYAMMVFTQLIKAKIVQHAQQDVKPVIVKLTVRFVMINLLKILQEFVNVSLEHISQDKHV